MRRLAFKFLDNPLAGLAPWIVYTLTSGPGRLELSCVLALGSALAIVFLGRLRGGSLKLLELSDVTFFGALAIVVAVAPESTYRWLETWSGEVANIALVVIAVGSILIRQPFTLQYAREQAPREVWDTPQFMHINYVITGVWAAAFVVEAASGAYGDAVLHNSNNIWTGWIIQTLPLIVAGYFTAWYPDVAQARFARERGAQTDPPPPLSELLVSLTGWLTAVGIVVLVAGGGPTWLGIAFIVVGVVLTRLLARNVAAHRRAVREGPSAPGASGPGGS